jgi:hypothetical protein
MREVHDHAIYRSERPQRAAAPFPGVIMHLPSPPNYMHDHDLSLGRRPHNLA